jgi:glycosyltransferase involved in cell wall biosynthesis
MAGQPAVLQCALQSSFWKVEAMGLPLASCICATYNRPPYHQDLLEEAIESFLRQDYPHKELIVLNDTPGQELHCDAEGVVVVNAGERFSTLGEKHNAMVGLSRGEVIAVWDDDDISLPWRLSLTVDRLGDAGYFNPRSYWFWPQGGLRHDHTIGISHNAAAFTRAAFDLVGGYRPISNGYDRDMDQALVSVLERVVDPRRGSPPLSMEEWFYIYRWGVSLGHVSMGATSDDGRYPEIGEQPVMPGCFYLEPHWEMDYVQEVRRVLEGIGKAGPFGRLRAMTKRLTMLRSSARHGFRK